MKIFSIELEVNQRKLKPKFPDENIHCSWLAFVPFSPCMIGRIQNPAVQRFLCVQVIYFAQILRNVNFCPRSINKG